MSGMDVCSDNRFELIAKARDALLESTNIEDSPDEMAVLDDILFRCWQMGWLDRLEVVRCRDCRHMEQLTFNDPITGTDCRCFRCNYFNQPTKRNGFCAWGSRK